MPGQTRKPREVAKRPTRVKVMTVTYVVKWLDENEWYQQHLDMESVGLTERDSGHIFIRCDESSHEDALRATLLHEVLHTCTQSNRLDKHLDTVEDKEEFFVALVAPILQMVMLDNPNLMAYLLKLGPAQ